MLVGNRELSVGIPEVQVKKRSNDGSLSFAVSKTHLLNSVFCVEKQIIDAFAGFKLLKELQT